MLTSVHSTYHVNHLQPTHIATVSNNSSHDINQRIHHNWKRIPLSTREKTNYSTSPSLSIHSWFLQWIGRHLGFVSATMGFFRVPWPRTDRNTIASWPALSPLNLFGRIYRDVSFSVRSPPSNCLLCCLQAYKRRYLMMLCFSMTAFCNGDGNGTGERIQQGNWIIIASYP